MGLRWDSLYWLPAYLWNNPHINRYFFILFVNFQPDFRSLPIFVEADFSFRWFFLSMNPSSWHHKNFAVGNARLVWRNLNLGPPKICPSWLGNFLSLTKGSYRCDAKTLKKCFRDTILKMRETINLLNETANMIWDIPASSLKRVKHPYCWHCQVTFPKKSCKIGPLRCKTLPI